MGQRLNIQLEIDIPNSGDRQVLANAYYHWSGYTSTAYELVKAIADSPYCCEDCTFTDPVEQAIRMLEATGAGLTEDEFTEEYPESKYKKATSRNNGLIAISEEGIKVTQNWEEARVTINLSTNMVDMGGVYYIIEPDELDEYEDVENIPELETDLYTSIFEFNKVYNEFHKKVESKGNYRVIDTHKQLLGVIG